MCLERGPWQADQVELTVRSFSPLSLPDGEVDVEVLKPTDGVTPGPRRFLLAISVNGEEVERRWIQAELRVFADVIVAARSLAYHETITIDDIRMGRRELNTFSLRALTDPQEVVGRHAVRTIEMNEVLTPAMVSLPQVVQRGNRVSLVFESVGLRAEIAGRAMQGENRREDPGGKYVFGKDHRRTNPRCTHGEGELMGNSSRESRVRSSESKITMPQFAIRNPQSAICWLLATGYFLLLSACSSQQMKVRFDPRPSPEELAQEVSRASQTPVALSSPAPVSAGSLWPSDDRAFFYGDRKALKIGDSVTIRVVETAKASNTADTDLSRASSREHRSERATGVARSAGSLRT